MSSNEAGDPVVRLAEGFCYMRCEIDIRSAVCNFTLRLYPHAKLLSVPRFDLSLVHTVIAAGKYLARILSHYQLFC
jgi:hypothetical protein